MPFALPNDPYRPAIVLTRPSGEIRRTLLLGPPATTMLPSGAIATAEGWSKRAFAHRLSREPEWPARPASV